LEPRESQLGLAALATLHGVARPRAERVDTLLGYGVALAVGIDQLDPSGEPQGS
jgi:hypothetical protein